MKKQRGRKFQKGDEPSDSQAGPSYSQAGPSYSQAGPSHSQETTRQFQLQSAPRRTFPTSYRDPDPGPSSHQPRSQPLQLQTPSLSRNQPPSASSRRPREQKWKEDKYAKISKQHQYFYPPTEKMSSMSIRGTGPQPQESASFPKPPDVTKPGGQVMISPSEPTPGERPSKGSKQQSKGRGQPRSSEPILAPPGDIEKPTSLPSSSTEQKPVVTAPSGKQILKDIMKKDDRVWEIPKRNNEIIKHNREYISRQITIEVNYLPITMNKTNLQIFHYDVEFKPDVPKYLLRHALRMMLQKYSPSRHPAFDGRKNMYVAGTKLKFPKGDTVRDTVRVHNAERAKDIDFDITIKYVDQDLNLTSLFQYMKDGKTSEMPQEVIQGVDIALRSNLANRFVTAGRSFFSRPIKEPAYLGEGLELWHGFYQSAIMSWKPYLNVDVANKGFPTRQFVTEFLTYELKLGEDDLRNGLQAQHHTRLLRFLKGLKVDYELPNIRLSKRTYKVIGLGRDAISHRFNMTEEGKPDREMSVMEYFDKIKKYRIKYPKLPLIWVGSPQKQMMLPAELCLITEGQTVMRKLDERQTSVMVRQAATATHVRKGRIMENIALAKYAKDDVLNEFNITVGTNFEKVDAHVLKPPTIGYKFDESASVSKGVWRQEQQHQFLESPDLEKWAVINTDNRCRNGNKMVDLLIRQGDQMGIRLNRPICSEIFIDRPNQNILEKSLNDLGKKGVKIVIVIMLRFPNDLYGSIKRASEFKTGVLTQCIKSSTVDKINPMTAANLLLKINAKISGINHIISPKFMPSILKEPCMIIGADVTHPSPGSEGFPSIAAVAASHDPYGFKYNMLYRIQPSRMEMIADLEEMIRTQLMTFYQKTNVRPHRLFYFRDGVSEGQFQQLLSVEMQAIRNACSKLNADYKPGLTIVVVQKRHHTRFFPSERDGDPKNRNTPSGTLVDSKITHPTELDFYLVSHQSIQGTARPTKYHLLWDDNNLGDENLQILTFYLCFMFSRCTRAVSYPAPTYYAHLAAFRARAWYEGIDIKYSTLTNLQQFKNKQDNVGKIHEKLIENTPMFFV